ncbi:hypothetical protein [Flavobacterium sp. CS20]|uniref:hypothetical protein n=1 Tax=Flavobacterium sp. CS20 TaxID=2775246 RepID=UPI001B39D67F|nr:hypothetical protein [Flavobacterium sp. CS20]QTY26822.1 hypothetical protein IGB25_13245 [Flavobacterium sp. CS20]
MSSKSFFLIIMAIGSLFYSCSNEPEYKEYKIIDLSKPISDTLKFEKDGRIIGVEILITGFVNGKSVLEFKNGAGRFTKIDLEDIVNEKYETEWYSPNLNFKYLPESQILGDSLVLKYRMY